MTEDFDEEVVFENSPLFQYLQDLGHTDFEACSPISHREDLNGFSEQKIFPQAVMPPARRHGFWRVVDALRPLNPFQQHRLTQEEEQQLDNMFRQFSLRYILSQNVLLQEDIELIELLDPSALSQGSTTVCPSAATVLSAPRFLSPPSLWDLSVFVGLLAALLSVWFVCVDTQQGALWMGLCVVALCVCRVLSLWHKAGVQRFVQSQAVELENIVSNSRVLINLTRKSLRLIQETEVISRGFTLVSAACPLNRRGVHRSQLIGLRKTTYRSLRSAFRASRLATCIMLKSFPLNSEIDNVTNYVSTVPVEELGLGLGPEHLSEDEIQELTDDFGLPALKMLFQLFVGQSSEFFRRLVLLLSQAREEQELAQRKPTYCMVSLLCNSLQNTIAGSLGDLQRSYDFHRYFETQPQSSERIRQAHQKCRELSTLHTSVRSIQLHLKALLNDMIILEDALEKQMVAEESEEVTTKDYQELQKYLQLSQPHIQASACCWDNIQEQVNRITRTPICQESPDGLKNVTAPEPVSCSPVVRIENRDPVPEEQELEAYVSDSDSETEGGGASSVLSMWEREHQRREREESRRVLLELKSVLGIRTSEGERDKRKLLLFSEQAALRPESEKVQESPDSSENPDIDGHLESHSSLSQEKEEAEEEEDKEKQREENGEREEVVTEFCCGDSQGGAVKEEEGAVEQETAGEVQLYQSDGLISETEACVLSNFLSQNVPKLSVIDRLTELHGSAALGFSSELAAQAAAYSHSFTYLHEHTYGDSEDEEAALQPELQEDA